MAVRSKYLLGAVGVILVLVLLALAWRSFTQEAQLRFTTAAGSALSESQIRVLCYETPDADAALADLLVTTDDAGRPGAELPEACRYVAALHLKHEQPSGKPEHGPAYHVYATSWEPGAVSPVPAAGDVVIRDEWTLVLFNVVASLAWQPAEDSPYTNDLHEGLRRASAYLYDLTDGQMAFGPVSIHTGGRRWAGADIRVLASNDYRPSVYVGGIVPEATVYEDSVYTPGAIFLGRYWDGRTASDSETGRWSQSNAFRTLIHEWAHYALFLYDEYQQATGARTYCPCDELPAVEDTSAANVCDGITSDTAASVMAYQYTATELWHPTHEVSAGCETTEQWQVHGLTDWETLARWGDIQGLPDELIALMPPEVPAPGPEVGLTGDLFGRTPTILGDEPTAGPDDDDAGRTVSDPTVRLRIDGRLRPDEMPAVQAYVLEEGADGAPARIVHQGTVIGTSEPQSGIVGSLPLLGIGPQDRARIFVDRYAAMDEPGGRFVYAAAADDDTALTDDRTLTAQPLEWEASLDARYEVRGTAVTTMTVVLESANRSLDRPPVAQLCAVEVTVGCHPDWQHTMTQTEAGTWTTSFTPLPGNDNLMGYGVVHVRAPGAGDLVRWFQSAGGVGPAHKDADAPLRDGTFMADAAGVLPGECNQVVGMPAASHAALTASLGRDNEGRQIRGLVNVPYDMDVLLPRNGCSPGGEPDQTLPAGDESVTLTLFYDQQTIDRLGIHEDQLRLLHFDRSTGTWSEVPAGDTARSPELGWIAGPISEDGIYAIGWVTER